MAASLDTSWADRRGPRSRLPRTLLFEERIVMILFQLIAGAVLGLCATPPQEQFHDVHFHLTNYIQEGPRIQQYLAVMGDRVGRSAVFGIPLQQLWSYRISG